jgi:hypothetical protein
MKYLKLLFVDFFLASLPPITLLALHHFRFDYLPEASYFDVVAHFFGGSAIAWSAMIIWKRWNERQWIHADAIVRDYAVCMTSLLFGTMWEWWEFWMQRWTGFIFQPSIGDTMQDLFMDTIGGLLVVLVYRLIKKRA